MEVEALGTTERGTMGFRSSDLNPKRSITAKEEGIKIYFVLVEKTNTELISATDISSHPRLMREREMLSSAHVNAALIQTMSEAFLDKIKGASKEDDKWQGRGHELIRLRAN